MKRLICLIAASLLLACLLTACGAKTQPKMEPQTEKTETAAPVQPEELAEEAEQPERQSPVEQEEPEAEPQDNGVVTLEDLTQLIGQDVSALYALIGEAPESFYEYSCSGPGDDGILTYSDFTVFTYVEDGVETIVDVEAAE